MTEDQALNKVASMLAHSSFEFSVSAIKLPTLKENAQDGMATNRETAQALSIEELYETKLAHWQFPLKELQP